MQTTEGKELKQHAGVGSWGQPCRREWRPEAKKKGASRISIRETLIIKKEVHSNTQQHIEGAYMITMGILILFWNILSLLMRLNRR